MNEIFSLNRFGKLLKNDLVRCLPKGYGTLISLLCIMPGIWVINALMFNNSISPDARILGIILITMLAAFLSIFKLYGHANHPKKGVDFTMLPASALEKFLSMVLIGSLIIPVLFFLAIYAIDCILATIPVDAYHGYITPDTFFRARFFENTGIFILFLSFSFCGNMLFRKAKVAKTILSVLGLFTLIGYITSVSAYTLVKRMAYQKEDGAVYSMIGNQPMTEDQITDNTIILQEGKENGKKTVQMTRDGKTYTVSGNRISPDTLDMLYANGRIYVVMYQIFLFGILPALMYFLTYRRIQKQQL